MQVPQRILDSIHPSWIPCFVHLYSLDQMVKLRQVMKDTLDAGRTIAPTADNIFRVFRMPLQDVRVVIVGQDPYPDVKVATGLSFSHSTTQKMRPSLRQIKAEIERTESTMHADSSLTLWEQQGVMLLNRALTTEQGKAGAHSKYWKFFTDFVTHYICENTKDVIWLLWGKSSQSLTKFIHNDTHVVLKHTHPQAANYNPELYPFVGCDHFNQTNLLLESKGYTKIQW